MITLEATGLLEGDASVASKIDYTVNGVEEASNVVGIKELANGQLANTKGTLYTAPGSTTTIITSITLVNTDSTTRTVNLYVKPGATSRRIIPVNLSLEADGGSLVFSTTGLQVFTASGAVIQSTSGLAYAPDGTHASTHQDGGGDDIDVTDLEGVLTNDQHIIDAEAIAAIGAQIAFGNYTGDGVAVRQIATGFLCKAVIIQESALNSTDTWILLNTTAAAELITGASIAQSAFTELHAADGFTVGANSNVDTVVYNYMAIG